MRRYIAHTGKDTDNFTDAQPLSEHLREVARRAELLARTARPDDDDLARAARAAGWLHDLGKYRPEFQLHIHKEPVQREKTYHKQAGAAHAKNHAPIAFAIVGHHGGMPDLATLKSAVSGESGAAVASAVWPAAITDCPPLAQLDIKPPSLADKFAADLFTRLLFSCLVDADWSDTGDYKNRVKGLPPEPAPTPLDAEGGLQHTLDWIAEKSATCPDPHVGQVRADVLAACLEAAELPTGLFTLTVPTGGGKTLSSLAFALKHALRHKLRRVIYVAPYLSILEQNAIAIRDALGPLGGEVYEHHSLAKSKSEAEDQDQTSEAVRRAENWDAPVVVTTNVQFFESLFASMPSRCRKFHNIARSVILLDECQSLPSELVAPTCGMLKQIAEKLGSTIVLCTATQPAFDHDELKDDERLTAREIIPPDANLFARLKRVQLEWPSAGVTMDWPDVARQMRQSRAALCVVNTRRAARELLRELPVGAFHLSTSMCPQHRREVLDAVKDRLRRGKRVYLVSTQLIEAGVDVDFPVVFREMAPLEGVIQAAGRCNREGRIPDAGGRVVVFRSVDGAIPPDSWYKAGRAVVETSLNAGQPPRIDEPADIRDYYARLYRSGELDKHRIRDKRQSFQFQTVSQDYRLIDDGGSPVVVMKWESRLDEVQALVDKVRRQPTRANFRELAPFQVNMRHYEIAKAAGQLVPLDERLDLNGWYGAYDEKLGVSGENVDGLLLV